MNKNLQTLLALQLISMSEDITTHTYNSQNKVEEIERISVLNLLKEAINNGLDIMLPLDENDIKEKHQSGRDGKITFIEKMIANNDSEKEIVEYLINLLKKEDLKKVDMNFFQNIYNVTSENGISFRRMFELGFDFKQGNFDEEFKATSGDLDFFECCICFKEDFDFSFKYSDWTLNECIKDEINYRRKNNQLSKISGLELLDNFIEKAALKQNFEDKFEDKNKKEVKIKI